jgi:multimeric flavodoxin WrbA
MNHERFSLTKEYTHRLVVREEKREYLINLINKADIIIFSFPLYVDHLPAPLIKTMEIIYEMKGNLKRPQNKSLIVISNSGFPEASQIDLAIKICQIFTDEMGFQWKGGLQFGGGEVIHGRDLEDAGRMTESLKKGLKMAGRDLSEDKPISQEAKELVAKQTIPMGMFKLFANLGWRWRALKNWNVFNLKNKPFSN